MPNIMQFQVIPGERRESDRIYALDDGGRLLVYDPKRERNFKWSEIITPYTQGGFQLERIE